jgi:hypothetical protein
MSYPPQTGVHTRTITGPIVISKDDNVKQISISVISGTCTVLGSMKFQNEESDPITLGAATTPSLTIPATSGGALDGITITPTGSAIIIVMT